MTSNEPAAGVTLAGSGVRSALSRPVAVAPLVAWLVAGDSASASSMLQLRSPAPLLLSVSVWVTLAPDGAVPSIVEGSTSRQGCSQRSSKFTVAVSPVVILTASASPSSYSGAVTLMSTGLYDSSSKRL